MESTVDKRILAHFLPITEEERRILAGKETIDRDLYMQSHKDVVRAEKFLTAGRLIAIRPHTRFIHFPRHSHDFIEVVYMCAGQTTHTVNGKQILLKAGELLFLSQNAAHEIECAGETDIAVNFFILPDFFAAGLSALGEEETPLRRFLVDSLCHGNRGPSYLHFRVAGVKPIQNLVENLLWTLLEDTPHRYNTSQMTMTLLFLQLVSHAETLVSDTAEEAVLVGVLRYIETEYRSGSLKEAAARFHYDLPWLSREIKRKTGKTYTMLVQEKRLAQAAFLLRATNRTVSDISLAVGYENVSYFHRLFTAAYGRSPKKYRDATEDTFLQK